MGAPKINITARLDHAKSLCKRLDFKRFISQELGMDVLRPEDLSEDDCFIMILEYVGAASSSQLDQLSLVTCEFIQMLRKYERGI